MRITRRVPPGATIVLGADETLERRSGRQSTAKGGSRDAVRSSKTHGIRCFGLTWVSMMLLVPVPGSRRVWAWPWLTPLGRPAKPGGRRRPKTRVDWVRQLLKQVRRWLPEHRRMLVVDGGVAAVALALACVKTRGAMVSRLRWDAARYHPPGPQAPGNRGPQPTQGQRHRSVQGGAECSEPPWERVPVDWDGGQRQPLWSFSRTALGSPPPLAPRRHPLWAGR